MGVGEGEAMGFGKGNAGVVTRKDEALSEEFMGGFEGMEMASRRLRVIGQCKAERKLLAPRPLRELEGVMGHLHGECFPWGVGTIGERRGDVETLSWFSEISFHENSLLFS